MTIQTRGRCMGPHSRLAASEQHEAVEMELGKAPERWTPLPDAHMQMTGVRAIIKRVLKLLVKHMPGYRLRVGTLRLCGYAIGKDVYVGEDLIIIDEPFDRGMVHIGDRAAISPRVTLVVSSRPNFSRVGPYVPVRHGPIIIESDAWLGTGAVVLPNVTIGEGAVVGANSVVTKDVKPYTIVGGAPARLISEVSVPWIERTKIRAP